MSQAPHHAPDEPKVRALALRDEGYSCEAIGPMVGVTGRTVQNWVARFRKVSRNQETPEIQDDWVRIVRRSQGVQHAVLSVVEGYATIAQNDGVGPLADIARIVASKELLKQGLLANVYSGTGTDKLQKESTPTVNAQNVLIVLNAERPVGAIDVGENDA